MKCYNYSNDPIDFEQIDALFESAYNQKLNATYWNWRFLNNPVSKKQYINYLLDGDKVIAYYAVSPCEIIIDNKSYKVALSNMTMTHPDYTRRGYFKLLANNMLEELKKDDFIGVFGFANNNSHYGFKKNLGWQDLSPLNMFSLDKNDFDKSTLENESKFTFETNLLSENDIHDIQKLSFTDQSIHLSRSDDWLNWRLMKNLSNEYYALRISVGSALIGLIIYKNYQKSIDIMEIFCQNEINKFEMLKFAYRYLLEQGASQLNCWTNSHSDEYNMMEKIGFKEGDFKTNFGIIPFIENKKLLDIKNWHYRFIDSDVF